MDIQWCIIGFGIGHNMINNLKFRKVNCNFQNQLSSGIRNIKKSNYLFVPADKTNNFYKMESASYNELLQKNITKEHYQNV